MGFSFDSHVISFNLLLFSLSLSHSRCLGNETQLPPPYSSSSSSSLMSSATSHTLAKVAIESRSLFTVYSSRPHPLISSHWLIHSYCLLREYIWRQHLSSVSGRRERHGVGGGSGCPATSSSSSLRLSFVFTFFSTCVCQCHFGGEKMFRERKTLVLQ